MKKAFSILLALTLTLTGCNTAIPATTEENLVTHPDISIAEPFTIADETSVPEPETQPSAESEPSESVPTQHAEELPNANTSPEAENSQQPSEQTEPTAPPAVSEPDSTEALPPVQSPAQQTPATPSTPTVPGHPTSLSTSRDTGSDKIWVNPKATNTKDYYEETDPDRIAYLEYLKQEGMGIYYWLQEDAGMRMYVGRTYGMPLYTSYENMVASTWQSSNPSVATVNHVGFVTPLEVGVTTISVSLVNPENGETIVRTTEVRVEKEPSYTFAELEAMAREEAREIADYVRNELTWTSDLELIAAAAAVINLNYVSKGKGGSYYAIENGELVTAYVPGYNQPFGTLITNYSTCAGDVRALGMVLEYLGFSWYHMNENQWGHQWCVVYDVDGQTAFADGSMYGVAGYGQRQDDQSNWVIYRYGATTPFQ